MTTAVACVVAPPKGGIVNAYAEVFDVEDEWDMAGRNTTSYFCCRTCGNCSRHYSDREDVIKLAEQHVMLDHSRYHPTYGGHTNV